MLRAMSHLILVVASSAVVVPYAITILSHLMYSHQPLRRAAARSLHPHRVYAFSLALLQKMLLYARYSTLYLRWKRYYVNANPLVLIKNISYGRNNCCLDLHLPEPGYTLTAQKRHELKPVVVFIFGGAWSAGDKSMYGAICYQLANCLDSVVCCPNYSLYPQGCVDDMIQDVVDCVQWINDNIHNYGGHKEKVMLVGHSAGAHLGALAILELLHDQCTQSINNTSLAVDLPTSLRFHESHYTAAEHESAAQSNHEDSSESSESFAVVSENGNSESVALVTSACSVLSNSASGLESSSVTEAVESSVVTAGPDSSAVGVFGMAITRSSAENMELSSVSDLEMSNTGILSHVGIRDSDQKCDVQDVPAQIASSAVGETKDATGCSEAETKQTAMVPATGEDESCDEDDDDNDSVVTVRPKDIERHATLSDLCSCIKAFVGLAGVYHIGDHYIHESSRGIEDLSSMTPAMYGHEHFDRFSPTTILMNLTAPISLPHMVLVHGTADYVVPIKSSENMANALSRISANVSLRVLSKCDHYDICFDLMLPSRRFHSAVMTILMETASSVF